MFHNIAVNTLSGAPSIDHFEQSMINITASGSPPEKMSTSEERTQGLLPLFVVAEVVGLLAVILMLYWCKEWNSGFGFTGQALFNWHPFFMTIGLIYLMGNAIIVFRVFRNTHKRLLKLLHGGINAAGLFFTLLAAIAVIQNRNESNTAHLYTMHSWIGVIAVTLYVLQLLAGGAAFFFNMVSNVRKVTMLPYHVFFGHLIFILGVAAALTGLNEKAIWTLGSEYNLRVPAAWVMNFMGLLFVLFGGIVIYITTNSFYKRYPRPEDSELLNRNSD